MALWFARVHLETLSRKYAESPQRDTHAGSNVGSDPTGLEPSDDPIHKLFIRSPVWSGLKNSRGVARRYDQLPNQYVPLLAEW